MNRKNKKVIYVNLNKFLYPCLQSALIFYQNLSSDMRKKGFAINPYDPCMANTMVNGKHMTVTWHVEKLNISHVKIIKANRMIKWIEYQYDEMRIFRGKLNDYLGIDLYCLVQEDVSTRMEKYAAGTIKEFPEDIMS